MIDVYCCWTTSGGLSRRSRVGVFTLLDLLVVSICYLALRGFLAENVVDVLLKLVLLHCECLEHFPIQLKFGLLKVLLWLLFNTILTLNSILFSCADIPHPFWGIGDWDLPHPLLTYNRLITIL